MVDFVAAPYEWRSVAGSDGSAVQIEVTSNATYSALDVLYLRGATQPPLDGTSRATAKVIRFKASSSLDIVSADIGMLWLLSPTDASVYCDVVVLGGARVVTFYEQEDPPANPEPGWEWFKPSEARRHVFEGGAWIEDV